MFKAEKLKALVNERLKAAAEEIFSLFEKTIKDYEEEVFRSKQEKEQQRLLAGRKGDNGTHSGHFSYKTALKLGRQLLMVSSCLRKSAAFSPLVQSFHSQPPYTGEK